MKFKILTWLAIILILEVGIVHYFTAQHEFEEAAILGYLFMANFLAALVAAYGIYRRKAWGWGLGLLIAAGSLVGYIWSRTSGLPGLEAEAWLSAWGVTSLVSESLFCLLVLFRPWRTGPADTQPVVSSNGSWRYLLPAAGLIALILVNYSTIRLDALFPAEGHEHSFSLSEVQREPVISVAEFEQQYGMQVSLVAVTALNSIIDVRLKVVDLEKAQPLLDGHTALLVGDTLILPPHQHGHTVKEGIPYIVFYPNQRNIVSSGSTLSLVFENMRLEPVTVQ
jgi:hypothetical protein